MSENFIGTKKIADFIGTKYIYLTYYLISKYRHDLKISYKILKQKQKLNKLFHDTKSIIR